MNLLPVAYRELVVLARRPALYWMRFGAGLTVALLSTGVILTHLGLNATPASLGGPLFRVLALLAALLCLLAGPILLADSLAAEKRAGTLGLLFLTNLRSHDIVAGKMVGQAMPAVQGLLAILPVMTAGFFLGGVSGGEFARTALALLNLLFCSLTVGVFCSALLDSDRGAFAVSSGVMLLCGGVFCAAHQWPALRANALFAGLEWAALPATALVAGWDGATPADTGAYTRLLLVSHGLAWLGVAGACVAVGRMWRRQTGISQSTRRVPVRRRRESAKSPLHWLARRQLGGQRATWIYVVSCVGGLWWLGGLVTDGQLGEGQFVLVAWALHGGFKVAIGWTAVRGLGGERDSGALEMLFVTPLGEVAVWQAWLAALRWRFFRPAFFLAACDLWLVWRWALGTGANVEQMSLLLLTLLAVMVFLLDGYTLAWVGLWQGLVARSATRATVRTLASVLGLTTLVCLPLLGVVAQGAAPFVPSLWGLTLLWVGLSVVVDLGFGVWTMVRVSDDLRETVQRWG
jgi:hypothetical protein